MSGDRVTGAIALERLEKGAFGENDERLLSTLATSMGVALENARLFDETKRLLAETDDRAAELSVINEIGSALARQLDFQAIVDLVGERVGAIFDSRSVFIALHDPDGDTLTFPYDHRRGRAHSIAASSRWARDHVERAAVRPIAPARNDRGAGRSGRAPGRRFGHRNPGLRRRSPPAIE